MDAILFRTHKYNRKIIQNIKTLHKLVKNVFVVYDATDRGHFPDIGVPVFEFTKEDYENSGYPIADLSQIYELPTPPPLGSRSAAIYFNPEYAQLLAMKWLDENYGKFDNYWYYEYDVVFNGNIRQFLALCDKNDADLLTTMLRQFPLEPTFKKFYNMLSFEIQPEQQLAMYGPLWRASRKFMEVLDKEYRAGKHGYYETVVPTLAVVNDMSIADINKCGMLYNPITFNGRSVRNMWSQDFVNNMKNMLFHPVPNPDTAFLFATGYLGCDEDIDKYLKWIEYYWKKKDGLGVDNLVIIDDGSGTAKVNMLKYKSEEKNIPFEIYDAEKLPDELQAGVNWIRFADNLGRPSIHCTPGWHRSFSFAGVLAENYNYDKIIHIEADTFVMTDRLFRYLHDTTKGWNVLYSHKYDFPDTTIQVIGKDKFADMRLMYDLGKEFWFKAESNKWFIAEFVLKFSNVVKYFQEGRYDFDPFLNRNNGVDYISEYTLDEKKKLQAREEEEDKEIIEAQPEPNFNVSGKPRYSISIVCYNKLNLTKRCINSIFKYSENYELLIWNNASDDGTKEYLDELKEKYPDNITVTHNDENIGFIIPQNKQCKMAKGGYFVVLNNDIRVCDKWLNTMNKPFYDDPKTGIVGVDGACNTLTNEGGGKHGGDLEYVEGSCLMVPKSITDKYGLFDSDTFEFAYCEDADFSLRLREKGYKLHTVPLPVKHSIASTSKIVKIDLQGYQKKNQNAMLVKWDKYFKTRSFNYRIVIKRQGAIGDVILTTPIIKALKELYPLSSIVVHTQCPQVFTNNPDVDYATKEELNTKSYDFIYDLNLAYEKNPQMHIIDAYAKECGVDAKKDTYLYPDPQDDKYAKELFKDKKIVVFHTQHAGYWYGRNLPIERYEFAADYMKQLGYTVVELGNKRQLKSDINLPRTSFSELCSFIKHADLFIGQDSALFHIAQSFKIPSIVPFGMINPDYRVNDYNLVHPLIAEHINCLGCHHWQPGVRTNAAQCLRHTVLCMESISDDMFKNIIDKTLGIDDYKTLKNKVVMVMGMARSGTSMTAGLCKILGVEMNEKTNPGPDNPKGGFEDHDFINITMDLKKYKNDRTDLNILENRLRTLIREKDKECKSGKWGFKSALTHEVIDHFLKFIESPYAIIVTRDTTENARSLIDHWKYKGYGNLSIDQAVKMVKDSKAKLIRTAGKIENKCFVDFDNIRKNPVWEAGKIAKLLNVDLDDELIEQINDFVLPDYCSSDEYDFSKKQKVADEL